MSDDSIKTVSGRDVGQWDGKSADDLKKELTRIKTMLRDDASRDKVTKDGVPHADQFPEDLVGFTPYILWGCDQSGVCLVGSGANRTETVESIREFYANNIAKDALARNG